MGFEVLAGCFIEAEEEEVALGGVLALVSDAIGLVLALRVIIFASVVFIESCD